jgi:hypothetical protein
MEGYSNQEETCKECVNMSNGKQAILWSCATLLGLVGILAASFFISNRSATQVKAMQGGRMTALSDLQADAKTLLGLAQVLSLFGVTLQVRARPLPFPRDNATGLS